MNKNIQIFLSYAEPDTRFAQELLKRLRPLERAGRVTTWSVNDIKPGQEWGQAILDHLYRAQIILLLVSPDYLDSKEYEYELPQAIELHEQGKAHVIPIILRSTYKAPFLDQLTSFPRNGKPVTQWTNRDLVYLEIIKEIRDVIMAFEHQEKVQGEEVNLLKALETYSERDLLLLSFDLGLPPDIIPRDATKESIVTLLEYVKHQNRMQELADYISKKRSTFS